MTSGDSLQFDRVETPAGASACSICKRPLGSSYYQVNGMVVCPSCRGSIETAWNAGSPAGRFFAALGLGVLAAILGTAIYFGFTAITGFELSLIAIVVGYLVGRAVRKGSKHRGGPAYQALAVFLTYSAIVFSYGSLLVKEAFKDRGTITPPTSITRTDSTGAASDPQSIAGTVKETRVNPVVALVTFIGLLYALPFLSLPSNIIGLVIIGIGVYQAWALNKRAVLSIAGPFQVGGTAPAQPA